MNTKPDDHNKKKKKNEQENKKTPIVFSSSSPSLSLSLYPSIETNDKIREHKKQNKQRILV